MNSRAINEVSHNDVAGAQKRYHILTAFDSELGRSQAGTEFGASTTAQFNGEKTAVAGVFESRSVRQSDSRYKDENYRSRRLFGDGGVRPFTTMFEGSGVRMADEPR